MALTDDERLQISKIVDEDIEAGRPPEQTAERIQKELIHVARTDIDAWLLQEADWNLRRSNFLEAWAIGIRDRKLQ